MTRRISVRENVDRKLAGPMENFMSRSVSLPSTALAGVLLAGCAATPREAPQVASTPTARHADARSKR
jgi:hypothetical protein